MQHHAPHSNAAFEGYYNKFELPSGAHFVLVISKIKDAKSKPNALTFTYVPPDASKAFQREIYPETMNMYRQDKKGHAFILDVPGIGYARWNEDSTAEYQFDHKAFSFRAITASRVPWSTDTETPEGLLVNLPLPLHWHVQSLDSRCEFSLEIPEYDLPTVDKSGKASVHEEKNWANAFPSAHIWIQSRHSDRGFCCAGGEILGMKAFLLGYRSNDLNLDFRPPFAIRLPGFGPFMSYSENWEDRSFNLSVQSFRQKMNVKATAPKGSFFSLSPPFAEGHRENFLGQSFQATVEVEIYESGWLSPWRLVRHDRFERAALEFGGAYYPPAGSKERFN